jgi:3D (Asp-Asp-Asp) domain-containing protein
MSKPLLGGSAAAVALLSASLLFLAQPSVAETLAGASQGPQTQQQQDAQGEKVPAAEASEEAPDTEALTGAAGEFDKTNTGGGKEAASGDARLKVPTLTFTATAYSLRGRTASGKNVARGIIAADRRVLPIGTRVRIDAGHYSGEYLVADTGGAVRGRKVDIWVPSNGEAMRFGRRGIKLTVLTQSRPRAAAKKAGK